MNTRSFNKWVIQHDTRGSMLELPQAILIPAETEADIRLAYLIAARRAGSEISGMCRVEEENGLFTLYDSIIPSQVSNVHSTSFLGDILAQVQEDIRQRGQDPRQWYCWWHSHVDGAAFFSNTDQWVINGRLPIMMLSEYAEIYPHAPENALAGPFVSLVGNTHGNFSGRVDWLYRNRDGAEKHISIHMPLCRPLLDFSPEAEEQMFQERAPAIAAAITERAVLVRRRDRDN